MDRRAIRAAVGAEQWHIRKLVFAEELRLLAGGVAWADSEGGEGTSD